MTFRPGDILAFYGTDWRSRLISFLTWGPSHVGIIVDAMHRRLLFESTSMEAGPCEYWKRPTSGAQFHWPMQRVGQYVELFGRADVWRLVPEKRLDRLQETKLSSMAMGYVGRGIAYNRVGGVLSGSRMLSWLNLLPVNRHQMFCSQLVHQALEAIGVVSPDNSARYNPAKLIRKLHAEETYRHLTTLKYDNWEEAATESYVQSAADEESVA